MDDLERMLGVDLEDPEQKLAAILVREDYDLLASLREHRIKSGLTQRDVADRLGVTQETVSAFERLGNDPRLSTIRRYAAAIGVVVNHQMEEFEAARDQIREIYRHRPEHRRAPIDLVQEVLRVMLEHHQAPHQSDHWSTSWTSR